VINGKLLALLIRGRVGGNGGLFEFGRELRRLDHFDRALFWRREQDIEILDPGVETPAFQFFSDPLGIIFVIRRADVMRPRRQALHVIPKILRRGDGAKFLFPLRIGSVTNASNAKNDERNAHVTSLSEDGGRSGRNHFREHRGSLRPRAHGIVIARSKPLGALYDQAVNKPDLTARPERVALVTILL